MQARKSGGALVRVTCGEDEMEGFRPWAGREEFIDEAAADGEPEAAARGCCLSANGSWDSREHVPVSSCDERILARCAFSVVVHATAEVVFIVEFWFSG